MFHRQHYVLPLCGLLAFGAMQAKAQTYHTPEQQSKMKSEAELSPEEQRALELERIASVSQLMANDKGAIEREVKAGKARREPLNLSRGLHISKNEADLIQIILDQTWVRLRALESRRNSASRAGLSMQEIGDQLRRFDDEKLSICENTLNSLKQQLGSEDFGKFDAMLRGDFPWRPPHIYHPVEPSAGSEGAELHP